jgi:hypothetical protein
MAVTPMQQLTSLLKRLQKDFTEYTFVRADDFRWSPDMNQISFRSPQKISDIWTLLHEIAHATLNHRSFNLDIELINREVEAWEYAQNILAPRYDLPIDQDHIEDHLDT